MENKQLLIEFKNDFWEKDPQNFFELSVLVKENNKKFPQMLRAKSGKYKHLLEYINDCVPNRYKDLELTIQTKIYFILVLGKIEFPKCDECHDEILKNVISVTNGFKHHITQTQLFCSQQCKNKNEIYRKTVSEKNKNNFQDPSFKEDILKRREDTMFERYHDRKYQVTKAQEKMLEKYGVKSPFSLKTTQDKAKETWKKNYGEDIENPFQAEPVKQLCRQTTLKHYGVEFGSQSEEVKELSRNTMFERYGGHSPSYTYMYDNKSFDSSYELCYYIFLKETNVNFKYPSGISFEYIVNGKKHTYYPDFLVDGQIVEIKGKHLINKEDGLVVPFKTVSSKNNRDDNETGLQNLVEINKTKYQCMLDNRIKILLESDLDSIFRFIEKKFNVKHYMSFCSKFRKSKQSL